MIFEKTHPSVSVGWEKQTLPGGCAVVVIKVAKSLHPVACIDGRVLKRRLRRDGTANTGHDVLRRDGVGQQPTGHAVGGGGVEAVAAEEGTGRPLGEDTAVEK